MVKPGIIYLFPMQCTDCGTVVQIIESEKTKMIVNMQGLPINSDVEEFDCYAICPKCGRRYEVEKQGMYYNLKNNTLDKCPHLRLKVDIGFGVNY